MYPLTTLSASSPSWFLCLLARISLMLRFKLHSPLSLSISNWNSIHRMPEERTFCWKCPLSTRFPLLMVLYDNFNFFNDALGQYVLLKADCERALLLNLEETQLLGQHSNYNLMRDSLRNIIGLFESCEHAISISTTLPMCSLITDKID